MPFRVSYNEGLSIIICVITGAPDLADAAGYVQDILDIGKRTGCRRVLIDVREGRIQMSTMALYDLPDILEKHGLDLSWKRAFLAADQIDDFHFYETVCVNRGHPVRVFLEYDKAVAWLTG